MNSAPQSALKLLVSSVLAIALTVLLAQSVSLASGPAASRAPALAQVTQTALAAC
jgi:hypothetical protein